MKKENIEISRSSVKRLVQNPTPYKRFEYEPLHNIHLTVPGIYDYPVGHLRPNHPIALRVHLAYYIALHLY